MELKDYMREQLTFQIPGIEFNGETSHDKSLYTVLNCRFPHHPDAEMVLFNLSFKITAISSAIPSLTPEYVFLSSSYYFN